MLKRVLKRRNFGKTSDLFQSLLSKTNEDQQSFDKIAQSFKDHSLTNRANQIYQSHNQTQSLINCSDYQIQSVKSDFYKMKQRKLDKANSAGQGWFNMKAPQITQEVKQNIDALRMRDHLFSKKFYKSNNLQQRDPKFFTFGRVQDDNFQFKDKRLTRKQKKGSLAQEFLAIDNQNQFSRKKFLQMQSTKQQIGRKKKILKMQLLKRKKQFRKK